MTEYASVWIVRHDSPGLELHNFNFLAKYDDSHGVYWTEDYTYESEKQHLMYKGKPSSISEVLDGIKEGKDD